MSEGQIAIDKDTYDTPISVYFDISFFNALPESFRALDYRIQFVRCVGGHVCRDLRGEHPLAEESREDIVVRGAAGTGAAAPR